MHTRVKLIGLSLAAMLAAPQSAWADWRYCYAASRDKSQFIVSGAFQSARPTAVLEAAFDRALTERQIQRDAMGCPRANDPSALGEALMRAVAFNLADGKTLVRVDWVYREPATGR